MNNIQSQVGQYIIKEQISVGSYGVCHLAEDIIKGDVCCVKIVRNSGSAKSEINILSKISHPNVVTLLDAYERDDYIFIFMELCDGITLLDFINLHGKFSEENAKYIFEQIVFALDYLHSMRISHGDIKLENIMCNDRMMVKIIDFGFASDSDTLMEYYGSFEYSAPEILSKTSPDRRMGDMWSTGVCFYGMLTGRLPFHEENDEDVIQRVCNRDVKIPEFISEESRYLIEYLLEVHPESRLTAREVLIHMLNEHKISDPKDFEIPDESYC